MKKFKKELLIDSLKNSELTETSTIYKSKNSSMSKSREKFEPLYNNNIKIGKNNSDNMMFQTENNLKIFESKFKKFQESNNIYKKKEIKRQGKSDIGCENEFNIKFEENKSLDLCQSKSNHILNLRKTHFNDNPTDEENIRLRKQISELFKYIESLENNEDLTFKIEQLQTEKNECEDKMKQMSLNEKNLREKIEKINQSSEKYIFDLNKKDEILKRNQKELTDYHNLHQENQNLIKILESKDKEFIELKSQLNDLIQEKKESDKRILGLEAQIRISKGEYDLLSKLISATKKENEGLKNQMEDLKIEIYHLKQSNLQKELQKKDYLEYDTKKSAGRNKRNPNMTSMDYQSQTLIQRNQEIEEQLILNQNESRTPRTDKKIDNKEDEVNRELFQNRSYSQDINRNGKTYESKVKGDVFSLEAKLNQLNTEKNFFENEIFKLPEKHKSQEQIKRRKMLEEKIIDIQNEMNFYRLQLRDLLKRN